MLFKEVTLDFSNSFFWRFTEEFVLFWFVRIVWVSTDDKVVSLSVENELFEDLVSILSGTIEDAKLNKSISTLFIILKFALLKVNTLVHEKNYF